MKTLDEVISIMDGIDQTCTCCAYQHDCDETECIEKTALHYLKHLQEYYEMSREHHEPNPALSWDELKQMEGKPVWVVFTTAGKWRYDCGEWIIIIYIDDCKMIDCNDEGYYPKKSYGTEWQAYRKERE